MGYWGGLDAITGSWNAEEEKDRACEWPLAILEREGRAASTGMQTANGSRERRKQLTLSESPQPVMPWFYPVSHFSSPEQ